MKVPSGVTVEASKDSIKVKGAKGTLEKKFNPKVMKVEVSGDEVKVTATVKENKRTHAAVGAIEAHLKNMFAGVQGDFTKKLQVIYAHFPVTIEVKGGKVFIKNFLGEKKPRAAEIIGSTKVSVAGQELTVSGNDKESVGQTANNLVRATRIRGKDIRVFQDGIYYS